MARVFVSHRGADLKPAEKLAQGLRAAGHDVWLDEWTIRPGDSIVDRINEGLETATHVVLCLSSSGTAPWMNREWMSTLARQLEGQGVRLLPVVLTGGSPPAILADIKFVDFTRDWTDALSALRFALD
jgi:hypothetical protein